MNENFSGFQRNTLAVMLDALAYYLESKELQKESLLNLIEQYEEKLDYYVVMAQMDIDMLDTRDETCLTFDLLTKKLECFEGHLKEAEKLYSELLVYLNSYNQKFSK